MSCQGGTVGPDTYPDSLFLFSSCQISIVSPTRYLEIKPFVAGSHNLAASTWMGGWESHPPGPYSSIAYGCPSFRNAWGLGSCTCRISVTNVILPFALPDITESAHLHRHFLHISQVRPMSPPALAAQTSVWRTVTSGLPSECQARSLDL